MRVVLVCLANTCRSPVAAALLRTALHHGDVEVLARGLAPIDGATPPALVAAAAAHGITVPDEHGVVLVRDEARGSDLLLFMSRSLLREAVVTDPALYPKSFTLREFARRALMDPPTDDDATFAAWLARLHAGRHREELLGENPRDDVSDPGLMADEAAYGRMIDELADAVSRAAPFLLSWGATSAL